MRNSRKFALGVAGLAATALTLAQATAASPSATGRACGLVTAASARTAHVDAPCVEQRPVVGQTSAATWGTPGSIHFLAVRVGPAAPTTRRYPSSVQPRGPHWLGPVLVAPGIEAYYTQSAYRGTPNGQGSMRFVENDSLVTISLTDTDGSALHGLTAVARSAARRL